MRKKLSSEFWGLRVLFLIFLCINTWLLVMRIKGNDFLPGENMLTRISGPIIYWIGTAGVLLLTYTTNKVYFDRDNLYIKRFRKEWETVPLEKVHRLNRRFPLLESDSMARYQFHYSVHDGEEKKISFYYRYKYFSKGALKEIMLFIKVKNPGFTGKHRANRFDFADY
jgi:hypothetical protein